ncbi:DUF222 domain-containing protein [Kribbella sp. NPDC051620]|uniref:HNH endonuclease signature motif containing protein n=1 Tax=Kribbella sp. NPDC051620 TaxID=3364120 RepID=UPI0037B76570
MDDRAVAMMSDEELVCFLDDTRTKLAVLQGLETEILDRLEQTGYAKTLGAHDLPRFISTRYRLDLAEAGRLVKFAVNLRKYPAVAAALPSPARVIGDDEVVLNQGQARAIVAALEQLPKKANVPVEQLDAAAAQMVEAARHMNPGELQSMGVQVRNILDTDGPEPREDAARAREEVWVKKADDGVKFGGYLAAENAEKLQTVLQAGAKPHKTPDGDQDPRPRGKRQADALVDALDIALASGDLPTRGGIKPHIAVTINLNDLVEAGRQATGDLTYGDGLSAAAIRRLACDAGIIPIVLGSDSQPLDVGREFRYVTNGLRNALNQRDKGCVICHAPPIYCDAHHLVSWFDGGITSLTNLVLLCRVDHTSLHDGHWTITITDNQVHVTRPSWADPPPRSTAQRLNQPSTTPATTPATGDADPWPSTATTGTPPTTTVATDPWPPTATTTTPPATAASDPWPSTAAATTPPAAAAADPWPPTAATTTPPTTTAAADPWPPTATATTPPTTTAAADPWPPTATATTPPTTTAGAEPWSSTASTDARPAAVATEAWPPSTTADGPLVPMEAESSLSPTDAGADGSTDAKPATTSRRAATGLASGSAQVPGPNWTYGGDAGWINAEEMAALDPWGDNPTSERTPPSTPGPTTIRTRDGLTDAPWTTPRRSGRSRPVG